MRTKHRVPVQVKYGLNAREHLVRREKWPALIRLVCSHCATVCRRHTIKCAFTAYVYMQAISSNRARSAFQLINCREAQIIERGARATTTKTRLRFPFSQVNNPKDTTLLLFKTFNLYHVCEGILNINKRLCLLLIFNCSRSIAARDNSITENICNL